MISICIYDYTAYTDLDAWERPLNVITHESYIILSYFYFP